ncbi:sphingomyelin phosphodiesterase-like [Sitodiplosis mosellana]|uniref:sphingomyelin phosphodiesterase-like n=1 Tax=Sitodiplosis mosellana TaxID=263140 RepID=UPI0024443EC2|nr:sphingomyelin phosphodiesterase-like [Sitodiplosis mosellana]
MKRVLLIIAILFVIARRESHVTNGFYILNSKFADVISMMNATSVESNVLVNNCRSCKWFVSLLRFYLMIGESEEKILKIGVAMCIRMKIQAPRVCESGIPLMGAEIIRIARRVHSSTDMSAAEVCSFFFEEICTEKIEREIHKWNVALTPFPKPEIKEVRLPKKNVHTLKVLHLSDTHIDHLYVEGANAVCNEPLCCRVNDGMTNVSYSAAGKWGSYRCDLPKRTLEHLLDHIAETHRDIDYVIWTGDLVAHDVWMQTNEDVMNTIEESVRLLSEKLPGIPIFPTMGNHERSPVNSFPTIEQDSSISVFYNDINTLWSRWLVGNVSSTLRKGAFYSTLARPGLRIISLNMNACNDLNFWLIENSKDPSTQLKWLIHELQLAEFSNEKVHIVGHIPPGYEDCLKTWSHNYYEIIARFENTVTAQFFGHTHSDEFEVFYDPKNLSRATNIAYIGPSVTPYQNLNPSYRIYYVDGDHNETTRSVVDHETWVLNLQEANMLDNPIWRKTYSARADYSMQGLRPTDWHDLIERMKDDDELFKKYFKNYWKGSPFITECPVECKREILCQAKSGRSHDKLNLCIDLLDIVERDYRSSEIPHETVPISSQPTLQLNTICICIYSFYILTTFVTFSF